MENKMKFGLKRFLILYLFPPGSLSLSGTYRWYELMQQDHYQLSFGIYALIFLGLLVVFMVLMKIFVEIYRFLFG